MMYQQNAHYTLQQYQPLAGARALALQPPSPLEQAVSQANNYAISLKEQATVGFLAAYETIHDYVMNLRKSPKRSSEKGNRQARKEREDNARRSEKESRQEHPSGNSKYARKIKEQRQGTYDGPLYQQTDKPVPSLKGGSKQSDEDWWNDLDKI